MMIKLFAINIVAGRLLWKDLVFSDRVKKAIKDQIILMVGEENTELIEELTSEE